MVSVFADGLIPWPKDFFLKTFGRLWQIVVRPTADHLKADGHVSMIARP